MRNVGLIAMCVASTMIVTSLPVSLQASGNGKAGKACTRAAWAVAFSQTGHGADKGCCSSAISWIEADAIGETLKEHCGALGMRPHPGDEGHRQAGPRLHSKHPQRFCLSLITGSLPAAGDRMPAFCKATRGESPGRHKLKLSGRMLLTVATSCCTCS
jgi:hypothetical protein